MAEPRPNLLDVLLNGLTAAVPQKPLFGKAYFEFSQAAMVAVYLYTQAAFIGVEYSDRPRIAEMIWDPAQLDGLWRYADEQVQKRDTASNDDRGLRQYFLSTEFPTLYGPAGLLTGLSDLRAVERIARSKIPADGSLRMQWAMYVAEGLTFGLLKPDQVQRMIEVDFTPSDPASMARSPKCRAGHSSRSTDARSRPVGSGPLGGRVCASGTVLPRTGGRYFLSRPLDAKEPALRPAPWCIVRGCEC